MNDALAAVWYALAEGRLHFRTRAALERHQQRLAREQLRWVAAHSPAVARPVPCSGPRPEPVAQPAAHGQGRDDGAVR